MADIPFDKKVPTLWQIRRARHFARREAPAIPCPEVNPWVLVAGMWEIPGRQTAGACLRRLDPTSAPTRQVAATGSEETGLGQD